MACSFKQLTGTECGISSDKQRQQQETQTLSLCTRNVTSHLKTISVSGINSEYELLLARVGIFDFDEELLSRMTICSKHRHLLGGGWYTKPICRHPEHQGKGKPDRTVNKTQSRVILERYETLVPVGSGICSGCRKKLTCSNTVDKIDMIDSENTLFAVAVPNTQLKSQVTVLDESEVSQPSSFLGSPGYQPFNKPTLEKVVDTSGVQELNTLLRSRDYSPVRYRLKSKWEDVSERTKREHLRKLDQGVQAVLHAIAPGQENEVLKDLIQKLSKEADLVNEDQSLHALVAVYRTAEDKGTKQQILSIIVDLYTHKQIKELLPEVTGYQLEKAKKHLLLCGRGQPVPVNKKYRTGVTMPKVEHFIGFLSNPHFVQDVAYGTRKLKLTSGETVSMPNVVRNIISSRIIKQYVSYCEETGFHCLGERELYMILENCPAQQKKALQGLDNISAEGLRSVEKLEECIRKLGERGKDSIWVNDVIEKVRSFKRYLKGSYRLNISTSSRCPDHCITFALSDPNNQEYAGVCDHPHDMDCTECVKLVNLACLIHEAIEDSSVSFYTLEEREDMIHDIKTYFEAIQSWKCHLLRAVNQDISRQDALEKWLDDPNKIFVTQDFAMKFIPRRFKETQMEWFGKRGISWHISYCVRKLLQEHEYEVTIYSHIFSETISQNSEVVSAVMRHTLEEEKKKHPEIKHAYFRSDCAGSYASGDMLIPIRHMQALTGVEILRYDFSEPQAGKGSCDRSSAHQKCHVNRYLNEGHDIMSAADIKQALQSHGGIQGVVAYVVNTAPFRSANALKIPGISLLHNYEYSKDGLKVWKAYKVGNGKLMKWADLDRDGQSIPSRLSVDNEESTGNSSPYVFSTLKGTESSEDKEDQTSNHDADNQPDDSNLFTCPEPGCVKQFITMGRLDRHVAAESHQIRTRDEPLTDSIKRKWAAAFEKVNSGTLSQLAENLSTLHISGDLTESLEKGWALKKTKQSVRFPDKVRKFLKDKFLIGVHTGHKLDPIHVANDMRCARDEQGYRMFSASECLQVQQIRSFFSRMAAAQKRGLRDPTALTNQEFEDMQNDISAQEYARDVQELLSQVIDSTQEKHPIMYGSYNLCDIHKECGLKKKFNIATLVKICEHFELDIRNISRSRKASLIIKIEEFLLSCACARV